MRVLLPMVTVASEIVAAREIYERVARRLKRKGIETGESLPPLGVMVETPAAALTAGHLAQYADFLAIGSNDLTMYTLAADRASSEVLALYNPLHPAVLRMIDRALATCAGSGRRDRCGRFAMGTGHCRMVARGCADALPRALSQENADDCSACHGVPVRFRTVAWSPGLAARHHDPSALSPS